MNVHHDYREAAFSASSQTRAWELTCAYLKGFGFDGAFLAEQTPVGMAVRTNIEADWVDYAADEGFLHADPFFAHCFNDYEMMRTGRDHLNLYPQLSRDEVAFIRAASEAGLRAGVSIPAVIPRDGALSGWHLLSSIGSEAVNGVIGDDLEQIRVSLLAVQHRLSAGSRHGISPLSPRERDCLSWCADGWRNAAIAQAMGISESTVEFHLRNARRKLGARTREQAIALAVRHGFVN